jgi:GT2 family glycosyltransferase
MPAVSVLIVNYNAGPSLARTLAGLAAQTFADFEALIIDNASDDRSIGMAQWQVPDDRRFKFTFWPVTSVLLPPTT